MPRLVDAHQVQIIAGRFLFKPYLGRDPPTQYLRRGARWSKVPALSSQPCSPRTGRPPGSPQARPAIRPQGAGMVTSRGGPEIPRTPCRTARHPARPARPLSIIPLACLTDRSLIRQQFILTASPKWNSQSRKILCRCFHPSSFTLLCTAKSSAIWSVILCITKYDAQLPQDIHSSI